MSKSYVTYDQLTFNSRAGAEIAMIMMGEYLFAIRRESDNRHYLGIFYRETFLHEYTIESDPAKSSVLLDPGLKVEMFLSQCMERV